MARDLPLANPGIYSAWAQVALSAGRPREARTAALEGLQAFPRNTRPAGVPIVSRGAEYTRWFDEADEVLERTAGRQGD